MKGTIGNWGIPRILSLFGPTNSGKVQIVNSIDGFFAVDVLNIYIRYLNEPIYS